MSYQIMLACMGGFSTSMLLKKMTEAAEKQNIDVKINAVAETELTKYNDLDIILLGPQIGHLQEEIREEFNIPVNVIDTMDYGLMNGEKILNEAITILKKNNI